MKEKLVKLILEAPQTPCVVGGRASGRTFQTAENIADHLIANGINIPVPCSECSNNECCSIQEAMGESGYCSKGNRREG